MMMMINLSQCRIKPYWVCAINLHIYQSHTLIATYQQHKLMWVLI